LTSAIGDNGASPPTAQRVKSPLGRYGIHPLPARGVVVTDELVQRLRDEDGI
jgi:hypothetical protein